jgi:chitinase domain-containing protein 1
MILPRALLFLCVSHIYALNTLFEPPTCHLEPTLRGLNVQKLDVANILKAAAVPGICSPTEQLRYEKPEKSIKLAYVTPWNGRGYDLAKWFASKFTHISPVWYQLALEENAKPELRGGHDVDQGWLKELRSAYRPPKIVPRVQLQFSQKVAEAILYYPQGQAEQIVVMLVAEVDKYGYDGITLELPAPHIFSALVGRIGDALHDIEKELVLVIPPQHTPEQAGMVFAAEHVIELSDDVDYFAVMTYDHAGAVGRAGPNSPFPWMQEIVEGLHESDDDGIEDDVDLAELVDSVRSEKSGASKVLMGLPFYGYGYPRGEGQVPQAYTASDYLDLLRNRRDSRISWDKISKEHGLLVSRASVWYPSLLSLLYRLQLAEELGVGIAIWELGQGLDEFVDVL